MVDSLDIQYKQKQKIYNKYFYSLDEWEHNLDSFDYFRMLYRSEMDTVDEKKTEIYTAKRKKIGTISNSNNESVDSFCYWFSKKTSKGIKKKNII